MKTIIATVLVAAGMLGGSMEAMSAEPCNPAGKLGFVCGPLNAEDLVRVPGTDWIVASGMDGGAAGTHGSLHLVNARDKSWKTLFPGANPQLQPDKTAYGDCPDLPDLGKFSAHGINLRPGANGGPDTLYVVNHGGRESVEIFTLNVKGAEPTVTWIGCAVMPAHTWPNSVAPTPDGGFVVTDMFDPKDPKAPAKLAAGENTGAVYDWHSGHGFTRVPNSEMSGDNGVEVSPDGKWIYVAAWGNKAVVRLSRGSGPGRRDMLKAGFLVDNLRWAPNGELIATGQNVSAKQVFGCFQSPAPRCTQPWRMDEWDTKAMQLKPLATHAGTPGFGDATTGLVIGDRVFVGTFRGDRIAYFPLK